MIDWLSPAPLEALIHTYGLWVLFALISLEYIGLPLPGETSLLTAAIYAATTQQLAILNVVLVAAVAAIGGGALGYLLGRSMGMRLLTRHGPRIGLSRDRMMVGQYLFRRHGGKIVFFGRFVALIRSFVALLAGASGMRWHHFLAVNAVGGAIWAVLIGGGAYLIGQRVMQVAGPVGAGLLAGAVALIVIGLLFFRHHEKELEARARAALAEPEPGAGLRRRATPSAR